MTSPASSTEHAGKKRVLKPEPDESNTVTPPSPDTPSKKAKSTPKSSPSKAKADAWTPELRLKLFEAYQVCSQTKWEEVAEKVGNGKKAKECREQWQRATGKRIKAALAEKN